VYGLIELKFCPNKKLKPKEEDKFLAVKAVERLPKDEVDTVLANLARRKLKTAEIRQILSPTPPKRLTKAEANHLLAQAALTSLTEGELKKTLAKVAREKLSPEEIAETFQNAISSWVQSEEEIDNDLSMAAHLALTAIKDKDYHAVLKLDADEFIDQGMAVYGYGKPIKVVFAPKPSTKL
jgi:Glu-tRNA(Gln) amidotransferase subunit E-like FAD-binding protein